MKGADGKDREFIFCLTRQNIAPGIVQNVGITGTRPDNFREAN